MASPKISIEAPKVIPITRFRVGIVRRSVRDPIIDQTDRPERSYQDFKSSGVCQINCLPFLVFLEILGQPVGYGEITY